jgi:hypothetical protein
VSAAMAINPPKAMNAVKIGPDYFPVRDLAHAVETWEACRDSNGWGSSESPRVTACVDKKLFVISYNGRVWTPDGAEVRVGERKTAAENSADGWRDFR